MNLQDDIVQIMFKVFDKYLLTLDQLISDSHKSNPKWKQVMLATIDEGRAETNEMANQIKLNFNVKLNRFKKRTNGFLDRLGIRVKRIATDWFGFVL